MFRGTTILLVRRNDKVVIAGDGQVSVGNTVMKHRAKKVRKMYKDQIIVGFAGSVADAFALYSKFEEKLEKFQGNLSRAAVELAKENEIVNSKPDVSTSGETKVEGQKESGTDLVAKLKREKDNYAKRN